jgi:hypothetical protein
MLAVQHVHGYVVREVVIPIDPSPIPPLVLQHIGIMRKVGPGRFIVVYATTLAPSTWRASQRPSLMSAFGGKADIRKCGGNVC